MLQEKEQQEIIEKYVKSNSHYPGNEDLYAEFCEEAYNKAYLILSTSDNIQKTETFVAKIVNTTIVSILKQKQRYKKFRVSDYVDKEESISEKIIERNSFVESGVKYDLPDPMNTNGDIVIRRELLQDISNIVCIIHKEVPSKLYYDIFYLRYLKKRKLSEISQELNIPQGEVCKRMLHLSKLISAYLYKK